MDMLRMKNELLGFARRKLRNEDPDLRVIFCKSRVGEWLRQADIINICAEVLALAKRIDFG
jgi:hypothetical protein